MSVFKVGSHVFEFSPQQDKYRELRILYARRASEVRVEFMNRYDLIFSNPEVVEGKIGEVSRECLEKVAEFAVKDLIGYGIYFLDKNAFLGEYSKCAERLSGVRLERLGKELKKEVSSDETAPAGGFIGGGFGVEGAVQGIAIATAANVAVELFSNVLRSGVKRSQERKRLKDVHDLIHSDEAKLELSSSIYKIVFNAHYKVAELINENCDSVVIELLGADKAARAQAIYTNISDGYICDGLVEDCLAMAISLDPYLRDLYLEWVRRELPRDRDFDDLASFFGVELEVDLDLSLPMRLKHSSLDGEGEAISGTFLGMLAWLKVDRPQGCYVYDDIPLHKKLGARKNYFNSNCVAGDGESKIIEEEPGELLGLIDSTFLGSAEHGLAIGEKGFYWKDDFGACALSWHDFVENGMPIEATATRISFGVESFNLGFTRVSADSIESMILGLARYYKSVHGCSVS